MLGAIVVGIVVGVLLIPRVFQRLRAEEDERQLHRMCLGDKARAGRLIDREMRAHPGLSRSVAVARAIESIRRDNR